MVQFLHYGHLLSDACERIAVFRNCLSSELEFVHYFGSVVLISVDVDAQLYLREFTLPDVLNHLVLVDASLSLIFGAYTRCGCD